MCICQVPQVLRFVIFTGVLYELRVADLWDKFIILLFWLLSQKYIYSNNNSFEYQLVIMIFRHAYINEGVNGSSRIEYQFP